MVEVQSYLQWILKTTQIKLIHLLGGYTKEEYKININNKRHKYIKLGIKDGFNIGIRYLANQLECIAVQNYGCSKQEWIDKIYTKIQEVLEGNVKQEDCF